LNPVDPTPSTPVAIIGMGCMFPKATDKAGFWANIRRGVDAITDVPPTHWRPEDYYSPDQKSADHTYARRGGFLSPVDFPPLDFGIAPNNLTATDTTQLLGLMVARAALDDAGYGEGSSKPLDRDRVSVILGVTGTLELVIPLGARLGHPIWRRALEASGVPADTADEVVKRIADSYVDWQENSFPGLLGNVAAGRIANRLDLGGTNCVVDAACASSVAALNLAILELSAGRCDLALSGGLDTFNDIFMYMCFSKTPALSPRGEARPFDASCDGTILGEGLGILALKRLEDARRDGDLIYAVVKGVGTSSDGKGNAVYAPSASGQVKALEDAYRVSGVSPSTVELVEAHGTGTKVGDTTELSALNQVYRRSNPDAESWCALGSVKSQVGHTKAAAGVAGLIKASLALHHKVLPPTIKVTEPLDGVKAGSGSPFYVNTEARPWLVRAGHPRRAAVSAFGFGGSNFHCVLEEAEPVRTAIDWDEAPLLLAFSASSREGLAAAVDTWVTDLSGSNPRTEAARSRSAFRATAPYRLLIVVEKPDDLPVKLGQARACAKSGRSHLGIYQGDGPVPGLLAMLFPGQGSQYVGMLRELSCVFPQMLYALAEADGPGSCQVRLSDQIYPLPAFTEADRATHEDVLRATEVAQPAIGAVSLGLLRILEDFGVRPDIVAGHSFGELTALHASGRIDSQAFHRLAKDRGRLMAGQGGSGGGMLAVLETLAVVEEVLEAEALHRSLVIANRNAPRQQVLSGPDEAIERADRAFARRKTVTKRLPVSAAFHSPAVSAASEPFHAALQSVPFTSGLTPVFANSTALPYPEDPTQARRLLAEQLSRPVAFVEQLQSMQDAGASAFLEVGPDARLTGLVRSTLGQDVQAIAVDASRGTRGNLVDLASALAELAANGYPVLLTRWDEGAEKPSRPARKPGLTVKVCGANAQPAPTAQISSPIAPAKCPPPTSARHPMTPKPTPSPTPGPRTEPQGATAAPVPLNGDSGSRADRNGHGSNGSISTPVAIPLPSPVPTRPLVSIASSDPGLLAEALRASQESLLALQKLGEQTAALHKQFLEGQDRTHRTFQTLLEQHQRLTLASVGLQPIEPPSRSRSEPTPTRIATPEPTRARLVPTSPPPSSTSTKQAPVLEPTPRPEPATQPSASSTTDHIQPILLEVVSEKTGYPAEMLDLDMRLDADLGIDSIKRVEILSGIQERLPDATPVTPEQLGTLQTLREILGFLHGNGQQGAIVEPARNDSWRAVVLEVVSEKTGYPVEMLELDMRMDADLGIDSIKRVEILSGIQERLPDAPSVTPEQLGTLHTLREIIGVLSQGEHGPSTTVATETACEDHRAVLLEVVAEKTGYPVEMLGFEMKLDSDLGIDSIKRVEILSAIQERLPDALPVTPEQLGTLQTLGQIAAFLSGGSPTVVTVPLNPPPWSESRTEPTHENVSPLQRFTVRPVSIETPRSEPGRFQEGAEVWILDDRDALPTAIAQLIEARGARVRRIAFDEVGEMSVPERLDALLLIAPETASECSSFIKSSFRILRLAGPSLRMAGKRAGARLLGLTRLDGRFGTAHARGNAESLAIAGLVKTAAHEWPEVQCKAIDVDPAMPSAVEAVVEELFQNTPLEVGLTGSGRITLELQYSLLKPGDSERIGPGDLVVVTGGARGVTAEVAVALAAAFRPTLVLLGRSPRPDAEPDWLASLQDEAEIKRALASRMNGRSTPRRIGEQFRELTAAREIRQTLARIEATGARAIYQSVDVRDPMAIRAAVENLGPVSAIVHGAGVLADKKIEDLSDDAFAAVYDTKVAGLQSLVEACVGEALRLIVLFSSTTARFGRTGQAAYAAANEALNAWARVQSREQKGCRVLSVNWGPWDGGMVTPGLKSVFAKEGIGLIGLESGACYLVDEVRSTDQAPEVVILGGTSLPEGLVARQPMIAKVPVVASVPSLKTVFERPLDLEAMPILRSHVIDGRAVVPMALILEWLAQGAVQRNPGLTFLGLDSLRVLKGAVLNEERREVLAVLVGKASREDSLFRIPVELRGTFADGSTIAHTTADVLLADKLMEGSTSFGPTRLARYRRTAREAYQEVLFHGPELQGIEKIDGLDASGVSAFVRTGSSPNEWFGRPLRQGWLSDPLALDCAFQAVCLWCHEVTGSTSLPTSIARYTQFQRSFPASSTRVIARVSRPSEYRALADIEFLDRDGGLVARIEGYECMIDPSLIEKFQRNRLGQSQARAHSQSPASSHPHPQSHPAKAKAGRASR
jgi:acyl transferase domain-containing protein/NAD(P)-dependent dehydrogenase (short-subunit alcohol dehydrogenase family)